MMVTERRPERVIGRGAKRNHEESVGGAPTLEWRVLESGVLAAKTPLNVVTAQGTRSIWFEPRKKRLVCPHGWGQYEAGMDVTANGSWLDRIAALEANANEWLL